MEIITVMVKIMDVHLIKMAVVLMVCRHARVSRTVNAIIMVKVVITAMDRADSIGTFRMVRMVLIETVKAVLTVMLKVDKAVLIVVVKMVRGDLTDLVQ